MASQDSNHNHLTESRLRELFSKYDTNKDNTLDSSELKMLVSDVFKETRKSQHLAEEDHLLISKTVDELLNSRDLDKNKTLDWEEFSAYCKGKNIIEDSEGNSILI